ncbi:MAG: GNAT family N-acetyltransferase [Thermoplasmataceae archaeon]
MFSIRPVQWTDFPELVDSYYSYYVEVRHNPEFGIIFFDTRPSLQQEVQWFADLFRGVIEGNTVAIVGESGGKAVGLCDVRPLRPGTEQSHIGVLGITVRKEYRGKGIGKAMMTEAISKCREKFEVIRLGVFESNLRAIRLYEGLGFVRYGAFPHSVKRGKIYHTEGTDVPELEVILRRRSRQCSP